MAKKDENSRRRFINLGAVAFGAVPLGIAGTYGIKAGADWRQRNQWSSVISEYFRNHAVAKLQIGAGGAKGFTDWLNTDIEPAAGEAYLDATKRFPFPDGSLSYIFSEQLFEHLSYHDGLSMLRECHRTLKPGGRLRMATPNLLQYIQLFRAAKDDAMREYLKTKMAMDYYAEPIPQTISPECAVLNYEMRSWGHQFVYDPPTLRESLERAGFRSIQEFAPGESDDAVLAGLEIRHKAALHVMNDYETMVFQAVRA
jgi:predicted SAM-dependent methyltransferase